jgi:membrane associated rhomboid family serine protease
MGLYDRDYSREEEEWGYSAAGSRPRGVQSITVVLIIINVVVYFADQLLRPNFALMNVLAVSPESLYKPWMWWQFVTAAFAHSPYGINHILFNMFALFVFGRDVEAKLGRKEFLRYYLTAAVLGNVVFSLLRLLPVLPYGTCLGASGAVTAVVILYILYWPRNTLLLFFVLPVPAWLVGVFLIGSDVLGAATPPPEDGPRVGHDVHLTGAALAFGYWYFSWHFGVLVPQRWLSGVRSRWSRPRLKVHASEPSYDNLDAEADRVLEKVHQQGEGSLTPAERRTLEAYSRRMRQKLR